ncbi:MAG: flagellar hook basal-body protein [Planctomycetaceae bacterium]|nr:flagellar hook basal-body protein [Planctomycetaceae bacterium]
MLNGLYSAATAMDSAADRHEVISHNIAHADHVGYRRRIVQDGTFESALNQAQQSQFVRESLGTEHQAVHVDFTPGPFQQTGRSLDVALQGDGFFVIEGPDGPLYTRNGAFQLNNEGTLVTVDGLPVRGEGGTITLSPGASTEQLAITSEGRIVQGEQEVGRLETARFDRPDLLTPAGVSLFQAPDNLEPLPGDSVILQGVRERSNVSPVMEMVRMIDGMRQYEAASRALQIIARAVEQNVKPRG